MAATASRSASPTRYIWFDYTMFWNGGAPIQQHGPLTETNPVPGSDPAFADPEAGDFRVGPAAPAASADAAGGPLGGAGAATALPDHLVVAGIAIENGRVYLSWQGTADLLYDLRASSAMVTAPGPVVETVPGANGPQRWEDPRTPAVSMIYAIEARLP